MDISAQGFGIAVLAGIALGSAHLGALWLSVRRLRGAAHPLRALLGGAALRVGLLAGALLLVMDGQPERIAGAMLGVLLARMAGIRLAQRA